MKIYINYFKYVFKHKWYVMLECFKEGLIWRGLMHDLDKFMPYSFFPYARQFMGNIMTGRDKTGYYSPVKTGNQEFILAWFRHQKINKHHWQYWVDGIDGELIPLEMPDKYIKEMICDIKGASRAYLKDKFTDDKPLQYIRDNIGYWIITDSVRKRLFELI